MIDLSNLVLPEEMNLQDVNLSGARLWEANLPRTILVKANLQEAILNRTNLAAADLTGANLQGALLIEVNLQDAFLAEADLQGANLKGARLQRAVLMEANLQGINLQTVNLGKADLTEANLQRADLRHAILDNAVLRGANISRAQLTDVIYTSAHCSLDDGSGQVEIWWRDRWLNWSRLRAIGTLPLFGVSYTALVLSVVLVSWIGFVNDALPRWVEWVIAASGQVEPGVPVNELPRIPIPYRMGLTLVSSFLLAIGTTIFKLACPQRVQEFSETQWVEQHGRARLQYFAESWRRRWLQWPTLLCTVLGGLLAVGVILERVVRAFLYLWKYGIVR